MDTKLTQTELDALPPKTRVNPEVVKLYLENDFLAAYALHTDYRVGIDPRTAVGAEKDWVRHGELQLEFLKSQGLTSKSLLLDVGCGTGRLARTAVPYLEPYRYFGYDISAGAIEAAYKLAAEEGWITKFPHFSSACEFTHTPGFDYAWAFSVFIHLPDWACEKLIRQVVRVLVPEGRFYFSYVPEQIERRTGLKQFRHTLGFYQRLCHEAGLSFSEVPSWTGEQRIALARRL